LREHIDHFGAKSPEVRDWVKAQDLVFSNCASSPAIPVSAPSQIDPEPSWPGGLWAPYTVGRSILWQARTEHDDFEYRRLLRKAQIELENVLRDDRFASTHDAARSLLLRILPVTDMEAGARLMGLRLMSVLRADSRQEDLEQCFSTPGCRAWLVPLQTYSC
jgi:hypothetical protein